MSRFVGVFVGKSKMLIRGILQVAENYGGDDETRTRDLCRDRAAF